MATARTVRSRKNSRSFASSKAGVTASSACAIQRKTPPAAGCEVMTGGPVMPSFDAAKPLKSGKAHVPEKWKPVFRKEHAQAEISASSNNLKAATDPGPYETHHLPA